MEESDIVSGTLEIQESSLYCDASYATLGDVTLYNDDENFALFEGILIDNTKFDGFGFSKVESDLRDVQWRLHTTTNTFVHFLAQFEELVGAFLMTHLSRLVSSSDGCTELVHESLLAWFSVGLTPGNDDPHHV